jgi:dTDP-4-dehydrorhamnose reductase
LLPISTEAYPTPAKRPEYSVMDTSKIKNLLGVEIIFWKNSLHNALKRFVKKNVSG